jgi:hypothetical protein
MAIDEKELRDVINRLLERNEQLRYLLFRLLDEDDQYGRMAEDDLRDEVRRVLSL